MKSCRGDPCSPSCNFVCFPQGFQRNPGRAADFRDFLDFVYNTNAFWTNYHVKCPPPRFCDFDMFSYRNPWNLVTSCTPLIFAISICFPIEFRLSSQKADPDEIQIFGGDVPVTGLLRFRLWVMLLDEITEIPNRISQPTRFLDFVYIPNAFWMNSHLDWPSPGGVISSIFLKVFDEIRSRQLISRNSRFRRFTNSF